MTLGPETLMSMPPSVWQNFYAEWDINLAAAIRAHNRELVTQLIEELEEAVEDAIALAKQRNAEARECVCDAACALVFEQNTHTLEEFRNAETILRAVEVVEKTLQQRYEKIIHRRNSARLNRMID